MVNWGIGEREGGGFFIEKLGADCLNSFDRLRTGNREFFAAGTFGRQKS